MKKLLLISAVCLGLLYVPQAYADFEGVENVLTQLEKLQKKAQVAQKKYQAIESAYNQARQGVLGVIEVASSDLNFEKVGANMVKVVADNVGDMSSLESAIEKGTIPNYTDKNQTETYQAAKEVNDNILRKDIARLYAYAFTLRTNLAKERAEKKDELDPSSDSRDMLRRANKEAMESARRLNRIVDMQSSMEEFTLRLMARSLSVKTGDDEEGDTK